MGKGNLRIDLIESSANMIDGVLGEGVRHSTPFWLPARRAYSSERQEVVLLPILKAKRVLAFYRHSSFLNFFPIGYR